MRRGRVRGEVVGAQQAAAGEEFERAWLHFTDGEVKEHDVQMRVS